MLTIQRQWDRADHARRVWRLRLRSVGLHLLAALIGCGAAVALLRRLPAPVECVASPQGQPAMPPPITPLGPAFSSPRQRRRKDARRDRRRRRARREGPPSIVINVARADGRGDGWRQIAREAEQRARRAEMRQMEIDRDLLEAQTALRVEAGRVESVRKNRDDGFAKLIAERDAAQARIVELLGEQQTLRQEMQTERERRAREGFESLTEELRAVTRARDGWRGRALYLGATRVSPTRASFKADHNTREYGWWCPGCQACDEDDVKDAAQPADLCGGSGWVAKEEAAAIAQVPGANIENEIEASFWAFDAERKRTGAERDAAQARIVELLGEAQTLRQKAQTEWESAQKTRGVAEDARKVAQLAENRLADLRRLWDATAMQFADILHERGALRAGEPIMPQVERHLRNQPAASMARETLRDFSTQDQQMRSGEAEAGAARAEKTEAERGRFIVRENRSTGELTLFVESGGSWLNPELKRAGFQHGDVVVLVKVSGDAAITKPPTPELLRAILLLASRPAPTHETIQRLFKWIGGIPLGETHHALLDLCNAGRIVNRGLPDGYRLADEAAVHIAPLGTAPGGYEAPKVGLTDAERAEMEALRRDFHLRDIGNGQSPAVAKMRRLAELEARESLAPGHEAECHDPDCAVYGPLPHDHSDPDPAPRRDVVSAAIIKDGQILLAMRRETGSYPRKWETPGGKVEAGESPEEALRRELREELGVECAVGLLLDWRDLDPPEVERPVNVSHYLVTLRGEPRPLASQMLRWFTAAALPDVDLMPGTRACLPRIIAAMDAPAPAAPEQVERVETTPSWERAREAWRAMFAAYRETPPQQRNDDLCFAIHAVEAFIFRGEKGWAAAAKDAHEAIDALEKAARDANLWNQPNGHVARLPGRQSITLLELTPFARSIIALRAATPRPEPIPADVPTGQEDQHDADMRAEEAHDFDETRCRRCRRHRLDAAAPCVRAS